MTCEKNILMIMSIVVVAIILYHFLWVQNQVKNDVLNQIVVRLGNGCCSSWPFTHMILFTVLTIMFPKPRCILFIFVLGVLWELIENLIGLSLNLPKHVLRDSTTQIVQYNENWWAGSLLDIYFNLAGIILGLVLIKIYGIKINS